MVIAWEKRNKLSDSANLEMIYFVKVAKTVMAAAKLDCNPKENLTEAIVERRVLPWLLLDKAVAVRY